MERQFNAVQVDTAALAHNLSEVRRLVGPAVQIMAVVKADAYGHGLGPVGSFLAHHGADALGVMDLHEAVLLREAGVDIPVYILAGFTPEQSDEIVCRNIVPLVYDPHLAESLNEAAGKRNRAVRIQLKMDTGMNRLGIRFDQAESFFQKIKSLTHVEVTGLATHFSDADLRDGDFIQVQIDRFAGMIDLALRMGGVGLDVNNAANSAAILGFKGSHFSMVRPGLMIYGAYPADHLKTEARLIPAMRVASRVIQVKDVFPGESVSYGRTWTADQPTRIATVPVGYTHGYDRKLSGQGFALIRGKRAPIRGRVCMNLTMFDVSDIDGVCPGDEVVLLGAQKDDAILGDDLAEMIGTISYEVFCRIGGMNAKEYF